MEVAPRAHRFSLGFIAAVFSASAISQDYPLSPENIFTMPNGHIYEVEQKLNEGGFHKPFVLRRTQPPCKRGELCKILASFPHKEMEDVRKKNRMEKVDPYLDQVMEESPFVRKEYDNITIRDAAGFKWKVTLSEYAEEMAKGPFMQSMALSPHITEKQLRAHRIMMEQMYAGLEALADAHIAHRDIATGNLALLGESPSVESVLNGDTRLALADNRDIIAFSGAMKNESGKQPYLPLNLLDEGSRQTSQDDIYAAGISLYKMLFGQDRHPITDYLGDQIPKDADNPRLAAYWKLSEPSDYKKFLEFVAAQFDRASKNLVGPNLPARKEHLQHLKERVVNAFQQKPGRRQVKWPRYFTGHLSSSIFRHTEESRLLLRSLIRGGEPPRIIVKDIVKFLCH